MKAMYINCDGIDYAKAIVEGYKKIETRTKNVLWKLEGERVAVIRTQKGKKSEVIGTVYVIGKSLVNWELFQKMFNSHCVPTGSRYDCKKGGSKWCYYLANPIPCDPYPVPETAVRHGRSWCEF